MGGTRPGPAPDVRGAPSIRSWSTSSWTFAQFISSRRALGPSVFGPLPRICRPRKTAIRSENSTSASTSITWTPSVTFTDTVLVKLTDGVHVIEVLADVEFSDRMAVLRGLHILGSGPNTLGPRALRELINWAKVQLDVDQLRIEGAPRTSGAGPGRVPPILDF